ncbi:hypothetical protein RHSIM_Rhsim06G0170800 [Rhododendron simsii]|uniref:Uncharacterized protein n=1 Tax=Rhododendron simsii TaxID=118357 RepID=A0A834GTW9_RHOSS|nr:hypothetical protein RHSIM_Rhsim06G0170800 [Rhododendron simsii]
MGRNRSISCENTFCPRITRGTRLGIDFDNDVEHMKKMIESEAEAYALLLRYKYAVLWDIKTNERCLCLSVRVFVSVLIFGDLRVGRSGLW